MPIDDVVISYNGSDIATMTASGTKTLETEGMYCTDDITITYTKPSGGGPDLSNDTVTASTLLEGKTAHDSTGTAITGTLTGEDLLEGTVTITNPSTSGGTFGINGIPSWNSTAKMLRYVATSLSPGNTITKKIPRGSYLYISFTKSSTVTWTLQFSDLSDGVLVLNNGAPIPGTSSTNYYVVRIGATSSRPNVSFTVTRVEAT